MIVNNYNEKIELEKQKPLIKKAIKKQQEIEKGKIWEPVPDAPGNLKRLKKWYEKLKNGLYTRSFAE